jgi:leucyl aminopeptidase
MIRVEFSAKPKKESSGVGVFFVADGLNFSQDYCECSYEDDFKSVTKVKKYFHAKKGQILNIVPYSDNTFNDILVVGLGKAHEINAESVQLIGSKLAQYLSSIESNTATVCFNLPGETPISELEFIANLYQGIMIRNYKFNKYFVDKKNEHQIYLTDLTLCTKHHAAAAALINEQEIILRGLNFARDLVSEPGNILYPEAFAKQCEQLKKSGLKVSVLDKKQISKLGMNALLGVAQGSAHDPYVVIMEWEGDKSKKKEAPIALIGKGVTFDSGGISIKPSQNMGDMKYDMAGAGAVVGTMKILAERKAKVNVVGLIGLVENMPSGTAQRPGDVVKSMSGKTIEIDNTDAEGRLVLADVLWYAQQHYKPAAMINLATLTGAIVVALGEGIYAGLFANNDELAQRLYDAGIKSGEKLWRMPMHDSYDKQINSEIADVKNTSNGRGAGSITAAQFLQRFVEQRPWAHLDIAGTAWEKSGTGIYSNGATGFGVRLLNRLIADHYEK